MKVSRLHPFPVVSARFALPLIAALLFVTTTASAQTYTLTTLAAFQGTAHGVHPQSNVVLDRKGNLYGTTNGGGTAQGGRGTVYRIDAVTHALTTVAQFDGTNGSEPCGRLVIDDQGDLYGTTVQGGVLPAGSPGTMGWHPVGTVFKIDTHTGTITTLASFSTEPDAGQFPRGVARDRHGNLYGTTQFNAAGWPTLYEIAADTHAHTVLFPFRFAVFPPGQGGDKDFTVTDGIPGRSVAVDDKGNLYGTLSRSQSFPCGAVYELKAHASTPILLAAFTEANGVVSDSLTIGRSGDLYGTTDRGDAYHSGTVFRIKAGTNNAVTLATFDGKTLSSPVCGVVSDGAGNLYGIAVSSADGPGASSDHAAGRFSPPPSRNAEGSQDALSVFRIAAGTVTPIPLALIHGLGVTPSDVELTLDGRGKLYGTASEGGPDGNGIVFEIAPTR